MIAHQVPVVLVHVGTDGVPRTGYRSSDAAAENLESFLALPTTQAAIAAMFALKVASIEATLNGFLALLAVAYSERAVAHARALM